MDKREGKEKVKERGRKAKERNHIYSDSLRVSIKC